MVPTNRGPLGRYRQTDRIFEGDDHVATTGVHTFDIVPDPTGSGYLGYAGPVVDGPIDCWQSENLVAWECIRTDVLSTSDTRWATTLTGDGQIFLVVREMRSRLPLFSGQQLTLYESDEGRTFNKIGTAVADDQCEGIPANPFLFRHEGGVALVYYEGLDDQWHIRCRTARTPRGLADGTDHLLANWTERLIAAPAMFRHPATKQYYLLAESIDDATGKWTTILATLETLTDEVVPDDVTVLFSDDEACPFPFVEDGRLYLFTSKCVEDHPRGEIDVTWHGYLHQYDL